MLLAGPVTYELANGISSSEPDLIMNDGDVQCIRMNWFNLAGQDQLESQSHFLTAFFRVSMGSMILIRSNRRKHRSFVGW